MYLLKWRDLALLATLMISLLLSGKRINAQSEAIPIGQIQGVGIESPNIGQLVTFRGIVTGSLEQENTRGIRYYTFYVQNLPDNADDDPLTSDGIAVFTGRDRLAVVIGDMVKVTGRVTEFYGLTEIDDADLTVVIESRNNPLPMAIEIGPPADYSAAESYFESYEGMRVKLDNAVVVGPTHIGCGFAVVRTDSGLKRVIRRRIGDPVGQVINVLNNSDVECHALPSLSVGDEIQGIVGPLTFHFERFKIIQENGNELTVSKSGNRNMLEDRATAGSNAITIATFNLEDYFDSVDDTGDISEPRLSPVNLEIKQTKLAATINEVLDCPTLVALQEVENRQLLDELAWKLAEPCGFIYLIGHVDGPDSRGLDLALFGDPTRVEITNIRVLQSCSTIETGVIDPNVACEEDEEPLFSRPPLQVGVTVDEFPMTLIVNHFKSKRGGELETEPRRLAQAVFVNGIVNSLLSDNIDSAVIVLGDFNDYDLSPVMQTLTASGSLLDGLASMPEKERYSYNFDGSSQLVDWILVSPALHDNVVDAYIAHVNSDFPHDLSAEIETDDLLIRSSDHDIPVIIIQFDQEISSEVEISEKSDLDNGFNSQQEIPTNEPVVVDSIPVTETSNIASSKMAESNPSIVPNNLIVPTTPAAQTIEPITTNVKRSLSLYLMLGIGLVVVLVGCALYIVARKE